MLVSSEKEGLVGQRFVHTVTAASTENYIYMDIGHESEI